MKGAWREPVAIARKPREGQRFTSEPPRQLNARDQTQRAPFQRIETFIWSDACFTLPLLSSKSQVGKKDEEQRNIVGSLNNTKIKFLLSI